MQMAVKEDSRRLAIGEPNMLIPCLLIMNPSPGFRRIHLHSDEVDREVRRKKFLLHQLKHMEVRRRLVEAQTSGARLARLARVRQDDPLLRRGVAHDVTELVGTGRDFVPAAEEEAVAAVQEVDAPVAGEERGRGADQRAAAALDAGEVDR